MDISFVIIVYLMFILGKDHYYNESIIQVDTLIYPFVDEPYRLVCRQRTLALFPGILYCDHFPGPM